MDNHANMLPAPNDMREESAQHWDDGFCDGAAERNFDSVDIEELSFRLGLDVKLDLRLPFVSHCLREATGASCRARVNLCTDSEQPSCVEPPDAYVVRTINGNTYTRSPVVDSTKAVGTVLAPALRTSSAMQGDFGQRNRGCNPGKNWCGNSMREWVTKKPSRAKVRRVKKRNPSTHGLLLLSSTFTIAIINIMIGAAGTSQDARSNQRQDHQKTFSFAIFLFQSSSEDSKIFLDSRRTENGRAGSGSQ